VTEARAISGGFAVRAGTEEQQARRLILATGLVDELPAIPGLAECWGKTAFFCPYCDGYEFELGSLGILGTGEESIHYAILISQWAGPGRAKLFLNGSFEPTAEQLAELASRQIEIEREGIASVRSEAAGLSLLLRDGRAAAVDGFFLMPRTRFATPFAEQLGCALDAGKLGPIYKTDEMKQTSVPGLFACGDVAFPVPSVSYAVADGVRAGTAVHQSLVFGADRS
jgi:thioredoxin reductase